VATTTQRQVPMDQNKSLREHLVKLLRGTGEAHVEFDDVVKAMPFELQGQIPNGAQHSPWQELEHIRIAQWDIFEYGMNPRHESPEFPEGYWPKNPQPPDQSAWEKSCKAFHDDQDKFIEYISDPATDLYRVIVGSEGKTILRQAIVAADHNTYHLGQLVLLRRILGAWQR
jgi:hypothetical protein